LIRALTGSADLQPQDQVFATLDVTVHAAMLSNRMKVLFVDTVGFISDVPTALIESFASTLEDVKNAVSEPNKFLQRCGSRCCCYSLLQETNKDTRYVPQNI
jgi:hypothetical protein